MAGSEIVSLVGIIFALGLLMYLIMKGVNIFVIAFISSSIVALTGGLDLYGALKDNFVTGFVGFFKANYLIFLTGTLMGKLMEITNGAKAIAKLIVKIFGKNKALISIPLACAILAYGGVSVFVCSFAVFPIALEVFKEADLPRRFIPGALTFGCSTFAMVAPGAPQIHNAVPSKTLGVSYMAGTVVGFISCGVMFFIGAIILFKLVDKAKENGEHFVAKDVDKFSEDEKLPNGLIALIPLIITIILINAPLKDGKPLVHLESGVFLGTILVFLLLNKYQDNKKILYHVGEGCKTSIFSICNTCAVVAFGTVVASSRAFPVVIKAMTNIPGPPLMGVAIGTTVIAGVCGSASGALGIAAPLLGPLYLAKGVAAEAISRTLSISSAALDSLPHNGYIVTVTNGLCNESHKDAYRPIFWLTVVTPLIGTVVCVILFTLLPNLP
ncbi:GntP family permease [Fusobacterium sp. PH5-44]|uniref:GntP family permease n=1 Tax=unclassified Fusobacterium TaxID=2648384 RepID=UPI003D1D5407